MRRKNSTQNNAEVQTILKYSEAKKLNLKFSDLFEDVEIILLDTTGDFLLDGIKQLHITPDHIFVTDLSNRLYIFDKNGIGQTIIDRKGQSNQEYISLIDFDISQTDSLICVLTYPPKLMYFTFDGQLSHQESLKNKSFAINLSKTSISFFNDNASEAQEFLLTIRTLADNKDNHFILGQKFLKGRIMPGFQQRRYFTKTPTGETLFFYPLSNLVYSLDDKNVSIKYLLDFGEKNPPTKLPDKIPHQKNIFDFIDEFFPIVGFNSCWENDRYFYIQARIDKKSTDLLYDKKSNLFFAGQLLDDIVDCSVTFTMATNNELIGHASAETLSDLLDYMKKNNMDLSDKPARKKLFDFTEKEGNPIILKYKFKQF